jgi:hypothetical protein
MQNLERPLDERAVTAALNAAFAVSQAEYWFLGLAEGEPTRKALKAFDKGRTEWLQFSRDNPAAPAEALWIRGGALGLHKSEVAFAALPFTLQLAFDTFHRTLNTVNDALVLNARREEEAALRARMKAEQEERARRQPSEADLEGTPLEPFPDPLGPSDLARGPKLTEAGFQHRHGAQAQGDQAALQPASPEFLAYQQEQAEKEEAEKAAAAKAAEEASKAGGAT